MQASGIRTNRSAPQVSTDITATLRDIPVALLSDNMQRNRGSVGLQPYHRPAPLVGTAVTVLTRGGDNLAILRAFEFCRPGDVMVIDAGADVTNAVIGGILSFYGASIGLAGMVIDGAIRDVAEIRERTFPVYARGVNHRVAIGVFAAFAVLDPGPEGGFIVERAVGDMGPQPFLVTHRCPQRGAPRAR